MSDRGRDRATQLIGADVSGDVTKQILLPSAHKHEQRDSANEKFVIVTDNCVSAVNCPIKFGIVPFSWLLERNLLILQSTHCSCQHTNTNKRDTANVVIVTHKIWSAVNCPIEVEIVPISWLSEKYLSIHKTHTAVISTQTRTKRQRKRESSLTIP